MIVKRLILLPGKGNVIICIFILLHVLLSGETVNSKEIVSLSGSWNTASLIKAAFPSSNFYFPTFSSISLVLVTQFKLGSLQFSTSSSATEAVLTVQDHTQMPVLNKTDSLLKRGISIGGGKVTSQDHNHDYNYNKKRRRTPVYIPSLNISNSGSSNRLLKSSKNLSDSNKNPLVNVIWNGDGAGGSGNKSDLSSVKKINARTLQATSNSNVTGNEGLVANPKVRKRKGRTKQQQQFRNHSSSIPRRRARKPKLLKEITLFNRQNCLAKLLCGVQVAQPPTKSSSALNDYAYLVKAFFDRFSIRGIVTDVIDTAFAFEQDALDALDDEADDDEEDDTSSERRKKKRKKAAAATKGGAAAYKARRPAYEKYNPKYYEEYDRDVEDVDFEEVVDDDLPDFMEEEIFRRRRGRNMTHVKPFINPDCEIGKGNKEIVTIKRKRSIPEDINRIRRKRGISGNVKRGFMGFYNPRFDKTAYLDKRQLEMETTDSKAKQFNIAEEIAARLRSPRQCRLLRWFGNNNGNNNNNNQNQNPNNPNGMTTTITTITNTGGMVGNLERLGTIQNMPQVPQSAITGNGGAGSGTGSQVVTVIQQSPLQQLQQMLTQSPPTVATTTSASAAVKASEMLKNMGQSASNAMEQAGSVASHIGSTICPFNIQELQELILKAQNAPFPHFLTTPASPTRIVPAPIFPQAEGSSSPIMFPDLLPLVTSSTSISTPTFKATQAPVPASTTVAIVNKSPGSSRNDPSLFMQMYENYAPPPTPPQFQHATPPTSSRYKIKHATTPNYYLYPHQPTDAYSSPLYPTPYEVHQKDIVQQTRQPQIVPSVGTVGDDDEGDFDDDPYVVYEKYNTGNRKVQQAIHLTLPVRKKPKPTPKWMTTTTVATNDDDFYSYNDAIPHYSYGTQQPQGGYKVKNPYGQLSNQKQPSMQPMHHQHQYSQSNQKQPSPQPIRQNVNGQQHFLQNDLSHQQQSSTNSNSNDQNLYQNYIREFHQPPEVYDSGTRYQPQNPFQKAHQSQLHSDLNRPILPARKPGTTVQKQPKKKKKGASASEEETSDEDNSQSSDNEASEAEEDEEDDEEGSDEDASSTSGSGSGESRANLKQKPSSQTKLRKPTSASQSVEASEEDGSNEAEEKRDTNSNDEEYEESEEDEDDDENDGKRSYERNDFSKDRGGPPNLQSTTTEKPTSNQIPQKSPNSSGSGFFSSFINSLGSFASFFNRDTHGKNSALDKNSKLTKYPLGPSPIPPRPLAHSKLPTVTSGQEDSEEQELDQYYEDSEEAGEISKELKVKTTTTSKPKKIVKSSTPKPTLPQPVPHLPPVQSATDMPVIIEESSSWGYAYKDPPMYLTLSKKNKGYSQEDDSGEETLRVNPVELFNEANRKRNKMKEFALLQSQQQYYAQLHARPQQKKSWHNSILGKTSQIKANNPSSNKILVKTKDKLVIPKDDDSNEEYDETESNESEEENNSLPQRPRHPPREYIPPEPID